MRETYRMVLLKNVSSYFRCQNQKVKHFCYHRVTVRATNRQVVSLKPA